MNHNYSGPNLWVGCSWIGKMAEDSASLSRKLNIGDIQIWSFGWNAGIGGTGGRGLRVHYLESAESRQGGGNASGVTRNSLDQLAPAERAIDIQVNESFD